MYPSRIFEITSLPFRCNLDEGGLLFLQDPVMQQLLPFLLLQHTLDGLEVIVQVRPMYVHFPLDPNDSAYLAVLLLIHHHEGLRNRSFLQVIDLLGYLRREFLVFEPTATGIRIDHQSGIHHGVLVFRETNHGLLELQTV